MTVHAVISNNALVDAIKDNEAGKVCLTVSMATAICPLRIFHCTMLTCSSSHPLLMVQFLELE